MVDMPLRSTESDVVLAIKSDNGYSFGYREVVGGTDDEEVVWIGQVSAMAMTQDPQVGASFTGMMFGVFAFGEMEKCFTPADFLYAEFQS